MQTARAAPTPIPAFAPEERAEDGGGVFVGVEFGGVVVAPGEGSGVAEVFAAVEACPYSSIITRQSIKGKFLHLRSW